MATHSTRIAKLEQSTQAQETEQTYVVCWEQRTPEQQREIDAAIANGDDVHEIIIRYRQRRALDGDFVFWPDG